MKRKKILLLHVIATIGAVITISTFFIVSVRAEIIAEEGLIQDVKTRILYCLPILIVLMPCLAISGRKLAGQSKHPVIIKKMTRMKLVMANGIILVSLAIFLYYRANYIVIDSTFLYAQIAEFIFGLSNLALLGLNIKTGLQLTGRIKRKGS